MLEMTIVLPLLLLVLFGIIEMGICFARYQVITNAAREGARVASLFRDPCNSGGVVGEVQTAVTTHATQLGMQPGEIATTVLGACSAGESTVTVTYTHQFFALPSIGSVQNAVDLRGVAVMRNEV